jgi:glyoxylase-like metal-dependent hydrolase (beta-lactamase superfamily II)
MTEPTSIQFGRAVATVLNIGELQADLAGWFNIPAHVWPAQYVALRQQKPRLPVQCIHVALPGATLLVDACIYELPADSPMLISDYQPPPGLIDQLAAIGSQPEMITHVVITHSHLDHYNAVTQLDHGELRPTFPNAQYYLGRADWERATQALQEPDSIESRTLGVLNKWGVLTLVDGELDLGHGIQIVAMPGESPGHQIVKIQSDGQSLYCIGDLYHHPIEFEQLDWTVQWADVAANRASRQALIDAALDSQALIVATHIPAIYRLKPGPSGVDWITV